MQVLELSPVNDQSSLILEKREFALVGVSPFSSYFSVEKITQILRLVINQFDDFAIFIPDQISRFTLQALGYEESRINYKIRKQDNYLRNKVTKALMDLNTIDEASKIITLSSLTDNLQYQQYYNSVMDIFDSNSSFEDGCTETSRWILANHSRCNEAIISNQALAIAVQYFLRELPIFLRAPEILNINSCCFIYPSIPEFLKNIYSNYDIASKGQGFAVM